MRIDREKGWIGPSAGLATFIVDPPTMLVAGAAFAWLGAKFLRPRLREGSWLRENVVLLLCAAFQLSFWVLGPMMYFDVPFFARQGLGNDFMWNGYLLGYKVVRDIPTYHSARMNALAVAGWLVQPFFLWFGVQLGYGLFGRNRHQTGVSGLFRP